MVLSRGGGFYGSGQEVGQGKRGERHGLKLFWRQGKNRNSRTKDVEKFQEKGRQRIIELESVMHDSRQRRREIKGLGKEKLTREKNHIGHKKKKETRGRQRGGGDGEKVALISSCARETIFFSGGLK